MSTGKQQGFATRAIHAGQDPLQWAHCSVVPPLVMSTMFRQDAPGQHRGFNYGRNGNPTRSVLESCLTSLEGGKHAMVFSSGLGAINAVTSLMQSGDNLVSGDDIFGGTNQLLQRRLPPQNISVTFADVCSVQKIMEAVQPNTKMILLETPTNPLLKVGDIKKIAETVKKHRPDIIIAVDNSFLTCYFQRPLDLGADIVIYSLTKYMNGHSDIVMGAAITRRDDLAEKLRFIQKTEGCVPSPFDCAQIIRSLKTLELRMERHMTNGLAIAKFLEKHPLVEKVNHPYLPSHPQYELSLKQTSGHSGMLSFYVKGDASKFVKALKVFTLAGSLGGSESLVSLPSAMTHASVPESERKIRGITDNLIRMAVGLESEKDLIWDLNQALEASQ